MRKKFKFVGVAIILFTITLSGCIGTIKNHNSSSSNLDENGYEHTIYFRDYKISGAVDEVGIEDIKLVTEYSSTIFDTDWEKIDGFVTVMDSHNPGYPVSYQKKIVKGVVKNIAGNPFYAVKFTVYYKDASGGRVQTKNYDLYRQAYVSARGDIFPAGAVFNFSVSYAWSMETDLIYEKVVDVDEINIKILSYEYN